MIKATKPKDHYFGRARLTLPLEQDFWVFGYGSLMWHPGFPHIEILDAHLHGYHRRFCIYSHYYRGTKEVPGLVLGLDRGGSCHGLVYRVPRAEGEEVLEYLYDRELVTGVYDPKWVTVRTRQGPVMAATFVVDRDHDQYTGRLSLEETARLVLQGHGTTGACRDYLTNTVRHLDRMGLGAGDLKTLLTMVEARLAARKR